MIENLPCHFAVPGIDFSLRVQNFPDLFMGGGHEEGLIVSNFCLHQGPKFLSPATI